MKQRTLAILLISALLLTFCVGCGGSHQSGSGTPAGSSSGSASDSTASSEGGSSSNAGTEGTPVGTEEELTAALSGDDEVILLTEDIQLSDVLRITRSVTLDLDGHTITGFPWVFPEDTSDLDWDNIPFDAVKVDAPGCEVSIRNGSIVNEAEHAEIIEFYTSQDKFTDPYIVLPNGTEMIASEENADSQEALYFFMDSYFQELLAG